ncbi:MAG: pseudaminic acid synthase [Pseudomonadota bacterium]
MSAEIEIAGRRIGPARPPYVICELSGNHNGSLDRMLALIDAAAATGADAIKVQTYTPDTLTIEHDGPDFRIKGGPWDGRTLYDLYGEAHTPFEWHEAMFARAKELGVVLFSTPFDETATDLLDDLGAPAFKIASFEVIDHALIAHAASKGKPMIMSTGMANLAEIQSAVTTARGAGCDQIALLHCISSYPAPVEQANVATVPHLGAAFGCVSGLSDHTLSDGAAVASIALGGSVIEKHFTLARADGGPDAAFSLEPEEFTRLVKNCNDAWAARGQVSYDLAGAERGSTVFRRSVYAVADIAEGDRFSDQNTRSIRPGFGMPPAELPRIRNSRAARAIARGTPITPDLLA